MPPTKQVLHATYQTSPACHLPNKSCMPPTKQVLHATYQTYTAHVMAVSFIQTDTCKININTNSKFSHFYLTTSIWSTYNQSVHNYDFQQTHSRVKPLIRRCLHAGKPLIRRCLYTGKPAQHDETV